MVLLVGTESSDAESCFLVSEDAPKLTNEPSSPSPLHPRRGSVSLLFIPQAWLRTGRIL